MKKIIVTVISAVLCVMAALSVSAEDFVNAHIKDGNIIIEYSGGSGTAVISYYDGNHSLCGAALSRYDGTAYRTAANKKAAKIRIWFVESGGIKDVNILESSEAAYEAPPITFVPLQTPAATPEPEEEAAEEEEENLLEICRISVSCKTAIDSDIVSADIKEHLPSDGVMISETPFEITGQMTVLDYLMSAAEEKGLELDISGSYVRAIGAIGEFDGGPLSGWMYRVNGEFLQAPMDGYTVQPDDVIEILYTCDIGNDL